MLLREKLDEFLSDKTGGARHYISRRKARGLGHVTTANPKIYSFEEFSRVHGTWHADGPRTTRRGFIGAHSYINRFSYAWDEVFIGRYTSVGSRVSLGAPRHPISALSTSLSLFDTCRDYTETELQKVRSYKDDRRSVVIGSDVWIGDGAVIMPGVTVSNGAIIGANSVVTKDVAAHEIVAGSPARVIGRRFDKELSERLIASQWWEYPHDFLSRLPKANVFEFLEAFDGVNVDAGHLATYKIRRAKDAFADFVRALRS